MKKFVKEVSLQYENVKVKYIGGRSPDILFLDEDGEVVEKISLVPFSTEECVELLTSRGFALKQKVRATLESLASAGPFASGTPLFPSPRTSPTSPSSSSFHGAHEFPPALSPAAAPLLGPSSDAHDLQVCRRAVSCGNPRDLRPVL